jgi:heme exporter protein B
MFGINFIFQEDYDDGTLNQYLTLPFALEIITLAKITANWLAYSLPIVFLSPFIALMFGIPFEDGLMVALALLFATPIFVMIGAVAAAISLGAKKKRIMLSLLVLPLYIPVLIYGTASSKTYVDTAAMSSSLIVIIGFMLFLIPVSSIAGSRAIR